eukprot:1683877-Ditylum_brightwellii.AAC.1
MSMCCILLLSLLEFAIIITPVLSSNVIIGPFCSTFSSSMIILRYFAIFTVDVTWMNSASIELVEMVLCHFVLYAMAAPAKIVMRPPMDL